MEVFVSTERLHRSPRAHEGLLQRIVGKRTATPTSGSYVRELGPVRLDHAAERVVVSVPDGLDELPV